ncbi:MAG: hypothetical protein WKF74_11805 [Pyrinomonadaceae bacterium]
MNKTLLAMLVVATLAFGAACSNAGNTNSNATSTATTNTASPATNTGGGNTANTAHTSGTTGDDVPAIVRAALTDATSVTTQHKDLSASQVSTIERETNTKIKDTDHHSYLGFSTGNGARKQTGAATVVEANGKQMVIVYESRNGIPYIKEVRAEGMPQAFLDQFKGKGHDDKFQIGLDIKANGADDQTARAAADAIRQDAVIMQTLYGGAHSH